ncbi:prolyl oligopeptidase family serine peptidase [Neobacillus cucumis]|uniref:prolyl oligopeptidase family serine peptidase n=1 Tax=Neobacillus cucumis TaxID=1740721 RepID=UPI0028533FF5|nr:prolyl oligopeptidase family serine peptidase [Neobacillus cucumis]MDR4948016.1 prolyl oligopeptidase family serine peptidase [Neobacillus cucumis]
MIFLDNTEALEEIQTLSSLTNNKGVHLIPNIEYRKVGTRSLKLHLLKPAHVNQTLPLIVFIQGCAFGASGPQEMFRFIPELVSFAKKGYVIATVEHRLSNEALFPAQLVDVKAAVRYLKANANTYHIDPENVGVWGDSSGGYLASFLGITSHSGEFDLEEEDKELSSSVKAVTNWYGPTDFLQMNNYFSIQDHDAPDSPESLLIGGPLQENKEKVRLANPITYISKDSDIPPFLIMHGDADELVPYNQSELLFTALKNNGHKATMYKLEGEKHGTAGFYNEKVLELVQTFFDKHLKGHKEN